MCKCIRQSIYVRSDSSGETGNVQLELRSFRTPAGGLKAHSSSSRHRQLLLLHLPNPLISIQSFRELLTRTPAIRPTPTPYETNGTSSSIDLQTSRPFRYTSQVPTLPRLFAFALNELANGVRKMDNASSIYPRTRRPTYLSSLGHE